MRRRPRPDPKCWSVLANPRWFWFWMRYRRTDAAGTRGSAAAAAAAAAAVVAVFVPAAGRRWPPAAAERTPRRQNCPTTAGWRPGGPPPWPAWPGPWSWLGYLSKSDERIRMLRGDLQLNLLVPPMRQRGASQAKRRKDVFGTKLPPHLKTTKTASHARRHDDDMLSCAEIQACIQSGYRFKRARTPFGSGHKRKPKRF